ncbi:hypothetical protein C8J57DRAFT_1252805 [Mycena rebaudengoi]|nr:hypothetical protein C8J57DRAFT_1252805 [Mycena rebaudengoi]
MGSMLRRWLTAPPWSPGDRHRIQGISINLKPSALQVHNTVLDNSRIIFLVWCSTRSLNFECKGAALTSNFQPLQALTLASQDIDNKIITFHSAKANPIHLTFLGVLQIKKQNYIVSDSLHQAAVRYSDSPAQLQFNTSPTESHSSSSSNATRPQPARVGQIYILRDFISLAFLAPGFSLSPSFKGNSCGGGLGTLQFAELRISIAHQRHPLEELERPRAVVEAELDQRLQQP